MRIRQRSLSRRPNLKFKTAQSLRPSPPWRRIAIPVETAESEQAAGGEEKRAAYLFRHPEEKMIGGICGGLGDYFGIDPILVRMMWVVLTLGTAGRGPVCLRSAVAAAARRYGKSRSACPGGAGAERKERRTSGAPACSLRRCMVAGESWDPAGTVECVLAGDGGCYSGRCC